MAMKKPRHMNERELRAELYKVRRYLADYVAGARSCLEAYDKAMQGPSTPGRGRQIAAISNHLNYLTDCAELFGLGKPLRRTQAAPHPNEREGADGHA